MACATSFVVKGGRKMYNSYLRFLFTFFIEETSSGILFPPRSLAEFCLFPVGRYTGY